MILKQQQVYHNNFEVLFKEGFFYLSNFKFKGENYASNKLRTIKKYLPPIVGEDVVKTKFDMEIYSAIVENDGETGDYLKTTYYNCIGQNKPVSFKDDEYFTAEYGIQSRPANGERPYDFEIVKGLPQ